MARLHRLHLPLWGVAALLVLAGSILRATLSARWSPPSREAPRAVVLDVGQGDAILLDGPGDAEVLVDGGPAPDLIRRLPAYLGRDRTIDLLILTHPHADHLVGFLPLLDRYTIGRVLLTGVVHTTREYERFLAVLRDRRIPTTVAISGQTYDVGPFHIDVLYPFSDQTGVRPENLNSSSIVAMLRIAADSQQPIADSQTRRILLTGDAEADVEQAMRARYCSDAPANASCPALAAEVLKVPHHGSQDSSSAAFLAAVAPAHAIISVGRKNDYGHPHLRALKRLERVGAQLWRTDRNGDVTVTFGTEGLRVMGER